MEKCKACEGEFSLEDEGGIKGVIGTFIEVSFCPTCYSGLLDMFEQICCEQCEYKKEEQQPKIKSISILTKKKES